MPIHMCLEFSQVISHLFALWTPVLKVLLIFFVMQFIKVGVKTFLVHKSLSAKSHLNGSSKWTALRCWCIRLFCKNVHSQLPLNSHGYLLPLKHCFSWETSLSGLENTSLHFRQKISALSGNSFLTFLGCFIHDVSYLSGSNQEFLIFSIMRVNSLFTLHLLAPPLFLLVFCTLDTPVCKLDATDWSLAMFDCDWDLTTPGCLPVLKFEALCCLGLVFFSFVSNWQSNLLSFSSYLCVLFLFIAFLIFNLLITKLIVTHVCI